MGSGAPHSCPRSPWQALPRPCSPSHEPHSPGSSCVPTSPHAVLALEALPLFRSQERSSAQGLPVTPFWKKSISAWGRGPAYQQSESPVPAPGTAGMQEPPTLLTTAGSSHGSPRPGGGRERPCREQADPSWRLQTGGARERGCGWSLFPDAFGPGQRRVSALVAGPAAQALPGLLRDFQSSGRPC